VRGPPHRGPPHGARRPRPGVTTGSPTTGSPTTGRSGRPTSWRTFTSPAAFRPRTSSPPGPPPSGLRRTPRILGSGGFTCLASSPSPGDRRTLDGYSEAGECFKRRREGCGSDPGASSLCSCLAHSS
jgi:hypothetical protein